MPGGQRTNDSLPGKGEALGTLLTCMLISANSKQQSKRDVTQERVVYQGQSTIQHEPHLPDKGLETDRFFEPGFNSRSFRFFGGDLLSQAGD